eukprot:6213879-Pleurochrysis_carterae.AAC.3
MTSRHTVLTEQHKLVGFWMRAYGLPCLLCLPTGLGNYYGTIGAKFSHEPEYNVLNKEMKPPAVAPQPRQVPCQPPAYMHAHIVCTCSAFKLSTFSPSSPRAWPSCVAH